MKRYILKKGILSIYFIIVSFAIIVTVFKSMGMPAFPTYWYIDFTYIFFIACICFAMPQIIQEIVMVLILMFEFVILMSSTSLFASRGDIFSWSLLKEIGQLKTVGDMIEIPITPLVLGIVLILSHVAVFLILKFTNKTENFDIRKFYGIILMGIEILCFSICPQLICAISHSIQNNYKNSSDYYFNDAYLFDSFYSSYLSLKTFGVYGYYVEDLMRTINPSSKPEIKAFDFVFENYTSILKGLCKDSNVVMIYGESIDSYAISKELTPVLYAMKNGVDLTKNGIKDYYNVETVNNETIISRKDFNFDGDSWNFNGLDIYNNAIYDEVGLDFAEYRSNDSTNFSELKSLTGGFVSYNYEQYALPRLLTNYQRTYLHGNGGWFYARENRMESGLGFDESFFIEDMQDFAVGELEGLQVYSLDSVMINHYTNYTEEYNCFPTDKQFFTYIMTMTAHGGYDKSSLYLTKNYNFIDAIENSTIDKTIFNFYCTLNPELKSQVKEYLGRVLDIEYAVAYLIDYLYNNDILEKTIITFTGDHNAYGNDLLLFKQLYIENYLHQNYNAKENVVEGFIYSTQIKNLYLREHNESRVVSHLVESNDLAPTILTLLDVDYRQDVFIGTAVINKGVLNSSETICNKLSRSNSYGLVENNLFRSFDGKEIISNNKNYTPTQQDMDSFKNEFSNLFQKYNYILNKREE